MKMTSASLSRGVSLRRTDGLQWIAALDLVLDLDFCVLLLFNDL